MTKCSSEEIVDIAIIGAGPAGLAAGLYVARAGLKTVIYGDPYAGQLARAGVVENFLTITDSPSGLEIIEKMINHTTEFGATLKESQIKQITIDQEGLFSMFDENGDSSCAYSIILATGTKHKKLGVKGEEEFYTKGVGYCTICDGPLYKGKPIAIVGFGEESVQAALRMTSIASQVYLVGTRPRIGADDSLINELESQSNVQLFNNSQPIEISGAQDGVSHLTFTHKKVEQKIQVDAVFIEVGVLPSSAIASGLGVTLNGQFINVSREQETNVSGFFAAGDITGGNSRQAIVSAGDGARAAISAIDYIKKLGVSSTKLKSTQWGSTTKKQQVIKKSEEQLDENSLLNYVKSDSGFAASYDRYEVRTPTLTKVNEILPAAKIQVISAHWCPDCRRNVPKMAKIINELANWKAEVSDRDHEGVIKKYNIKKIPTFIVTNEQDKEIGRIIETPKYGSLEEDLLRIAQNKY